MKWGMKSVLGIALLLSFFSLAACLESTTPGGGEEGDDTEASPPAPPAELPSALVFPPSIAIDVDTVLLDEESALQAVVAVDGYWSTFIAHGPTLVDEVQGLFDIVLYGWSLLEIPVSEETTTYEETISNPQSGESAEVKIDFADFDYDGDGEGEGCSGHTAALPICIRLWGNGGRGLAMVLTAYPSEENAGAGRLKIPMYDESGNLANPRGASFDHSDISNKSSEFFTLEVPGSYLYVPPGSDSPDDAITLDASNSHHYRIRQIGEGEGAIKQINARGTSADEGFEANFAYLGQWHDGQDYWSGRLIDPLNGTQEGPFEDADLVEICAQISTGNEAEAALCEELGIAVTDLEFVEIPTEGEVLWYDFPEEPTF